MLVTSSIKPWSKHINGLSIRSYTSLGYRESLGKIKKMLRQGLDINIHNGSLILGACKSGKIKKINALIKLGANLNLIKDEALFYAVKYQYKNKHLINFLLSQGAYFKPTNEAYDNVVRALLNIFIKNGIDVGLYVNDILKKACVNNQLGIIKKLKRYGADIHIFDGCEKESIQSYTLAHTLTHAIEANHFKIAKYLISKRPALYYLDKVLLSYAKNKDWLEAISKYHDFSFFPITIKKNNSYYVCGFKDYIGKMNFLSKKEAAVIKELPFNKNMQYVMSNRLPELTFSVIKIISRYHECDSNLINKILFYLCYINRTIGNHKRHKAIEFLIAHCFNKNFYLNKALGYACLSGYLGTVKWLFKRGAHFTPHVLINALLEKNYKVASFLIKMGDINQNEGQALFEMCELRNIEAISFLVENGANIHIRDDILIKNSKNDEDVSVALSLSSIKEYLRKKIFKLD